MDIEIWVTAISSEQHLTTSKGRIKEQSAVLNFTE
jgi:hypothetical protein